MCPVDSQFAAQTFDLPNSQHTGKNIPHPLLKFWRIRKILFPVKKFCVFPNRAPYFGQIPDPENTLPDLVQFSMFAN